eukprot:COSAG01_NODE_50291_length_364_cov_1.358491_1_plen_30_part_10
MQFVSNDATQRDADIGHSPRHKLRGLPTEL